MKLLFQYKAYFDWSKAYAEISDLASMLQNRKSKELTVILSAVDHMS